MEYSGTDYRRKQSVHERLLNNETNSTRPFNRRSEYQMHGGGTGKPILSFDHVKQNAIKFISNEYEYGAFLSSSGVLFA